MAKIPVGLSEAEVIRSLAVIEAQAEINNVPAPRRADILAKARAAMEEKEARPPGPPPLPPGFERILVIRPTP